ncbi:MAG: hypothetical protein GEU81_14475 [Nitriliruptorales bacterium]|nr:hypothetical protein [Nitriliruptorales bacterium]
MNSGSGRGWAVLSVPSCHPDRLRAWVTRLAMEFEGIATLGAGLPGGAIHAGAIPEGGGALGRLLAGLRVVPSSVQLVTFVEQEALEALGAPAVAEMLESLGDADAAVVRGVPVTDALKRVQGALVRGGVDREGLLVPRTPQIIRRAALDEALEAVSGDDFDDPSVLLAATGHRVRVLRGAPHPHTHERRGR